MGRRVMAHIKLPAHVNAFTDRTGRARYYYRRRGQKAIALPDYMRDPEAFRAAYASALGSNRLRGEMIGPIDCSLGSVAWLVADYFKKSKQWAGLDLQTRRRRERTINRFRDE